MLFAIQIIFSSPSLLIFLERIHSCYLVSAEGKRNLYFNQEDYFLLDSVFKPKNYYSLPTMLSRFDTSWAKRRNTSAM